MSFALPDFTGARCRNLSICGYFKPGSVDSSDGADEEWEYGHYKFRSRVVRVRIGHGPARRADSGYHLHLDFSTQPWAVLARGKPEKLLGRKELTDILSRFQGSEFSAEVTADFVATRAELPPFIDYTARPVKAGDVELEMRKGTYRVRGAPIEVVSWTGPRDLGGDDFDIELGVWITPRSFGPELLSDALSRCERAFGVFFRRGQVDG